MKEIKISRAHSFYSLSLANFRKQFKDIKELRKVYVNKENKVFAGEWIDSSNVINFNGGYAVDAVKVVLFV